MSESPYPYATWDDYNRARWDQAVRNGMGPRPAFGGHPADRYRHEIVKTRRETRHGLHLLLTMCTFGLWALTGWPIAWAWNRFGPRRVTDTRRR